MNERPDAMWFLTNSKYNVDGTVHLGHFGRQIRNQLQFELCFINIVRFPSSSRVHMWPPARREKDSPKCTLSFGRGTAVYLWISSCLCWLSLKALRYRRIKSSFTGPELLLSPHNVPMWRYMQLPSVLQASPLPACDPSLLRVAPAACLCPQGNPADGAYACMRRPQSPGPCVVWLYVYVCGLPGPLLICPKPANGLPSDHGCLLYFCLHQLNSDRPLPPAGPNQAPAPPPHGP